MNFKLKGRTLLNGDFKSPDMPYAVFDDGVGKQVVKEIVCNLNKGSELLSIYKQYRDNMHIKNITDMLSKMEEVYRQFNQEIDSIKRSVKDI